MALSAFAACQDHEWDNHYNASTGVGENLYQVLEANGNYTKFLQIVKSEGMDSILTGQQTYTVWAPDDDALKNYNADSNTKEQMIENHISRYLYGTEDLVDTNEVKVGMLNGKYEDFTKNGSYTFGGVALSGDNLLASNGVVHGVSSIVPFYYNMYEKIKYTANFDSLATYLKRFDMETFNSSKSTNIGQNASGQIVYDSVFDYSSYWMKKYGYLYLEDSTYTMLLPTNTAYGKAVAVMKPCYKTFGELISDDSPSGKTLKIVRTYAINTAEADSMQKAHVSQMITNDLVFRKRLTPLETNYDSLTNTAGDVIHDVAGMFTGSVKTPVSNGYAYITDNWNLNPADTWNQEIRVEAEKSTHLQVYTNTPTTYSSASTSFRDKVSNGSFLEVSNTSSSALYPPQIIFDIPGTLAAKYNIYAVFAPITARDESGVPDSTKVMFYLNYVHDDGKMYEDKAITADPENGAAFITSGSGMTKMLVAKNFEFPFANINMTVNSKLTTVTQPTTVKLRIQTNVPNNQTTIYKKIMRIDCIIFEPVNE